MNIVLLPGDGIGPEIVAEARKVLEAVDHYFNLDISFDYGDVGGVSVDLHGTPITDEVIQKCKSSDAILFGAVGGAKWDQLPKEQRPEQAILGLRKYLKLFANLRPISLFDALSDISPIKIERISGKLDLLIVRELTGGLYFGKPKGIIKDGDQLRAFDTMEYTDVEIDRIATVAFKAAQNRRKKLTLVDKANVLETSRLWRQVVSKVAEDYPDVLLNYMYIDNCSMQLLINPAQFDVILTENTFGDILSDEASVLTGSIGMLSSASLGENRPYLYEPIHGSAPDIAGEGKANPIGCILSAAMMLEYSFGQKEASESIISAVERALNEGYRTWDIKSGDGTVVSTEEMGDIITGFIKER